MVLALELRRCSIQGLGISRVYQKVVHIYLYMCMFWCVHIYIYTCIGIFLGGSEKLELGAQGYVEQVLYRMA